MHYRRLPRFPLALSTTDVLLLIVMAALLKAHLLAAFAGSLVSLLFAVQHALIALVVLLHRPARSTRPDAAARRDLALSWAGTLLPLAMRTTTDSPGSAELGLIVLGSLLASAAILSLGRSFGIEPAHRGLQTRRLYRIVRHPIYAAYLLIVGGFLLAHLSWWNACVALLWLAVQVCRIRREEALLSGDGQYRQFMQQVRWRLVPGMW